MRKKRQYFLSRLSSRETGQALIIVLIFLMLGSLTLVPTLTHISTALKTGEVYEEDTNELYAADSGIEDAIWQIKYDRLGVLFGDTDNFAYIYGENCSYELNEEMNGIVTEVTIENVWLPTVANPYSTPAAAKAAIERDLTDNQTNRIVITDTALDEDDFRIKIDFYPAEDETDPLEISSVGIWIPHGFTYTGPSNIEAEPYEYDPPTVSPHPGGSAAVWEFSPPIAFDDLPLISAQSAEITFKYDTDIANAIPSAVAWIVTSGPLSSDIPMSWDIDTKIYKVISMAGDTTVEAYPSRCDIRQLGGSFPGDYLAIGNTLMRNTDGDANEIRDVLDAESTSSTQFPDLSYRIPMDATVIDGYVYWSGWFQCDDNTSDSIFWSDTCANLNNWTRTGTDWYDGGAYIEGHYDGNGAAHRNLELTLPIPLNGRLTDSVVIGWTQAESGTLEPLSDVTNGDALQYQLYDGSTWGPLTTAFQDDIGTTFLPYYFILPEQYYSANFKIRFYLYGFSGSSEYCRIDNIHVCNVIDSSVTFKIGEPLSPDYSGTLSALEYYVLGNANEGEYSYACRQRVKTLLETYSVNGTEESTTGNGKYTVGGVDGDTGEHWSYAAWSLIIIYSSPQTAGHQIYLFDRFAFCQQNSNLDFDFDGNGGGDISGFIIPERIEGEDNVATISTFVGEGDKCWYKDYIALNAPESYRTHPIDIPDSYKLWDGITLPSSPTNYHNTEISPNNVWNSRSRGSTEAVIDGFDLDTFYVTWDSGLLHADDTEARIDIYTQNDNWNLIYIILSFRSKTTIGGTTSYVIRSG